MPFSYNQWKNVNVKKFLDDNNTIFEKGPFTVDGKTYEWKFIDQKNDNEDYCDITQLIDWDVKVKKIIE